MKNYQAWDYAVVSIYNGNVVALEANEWDATIKSHRTVTLYLKPDQAIWIAGQLNACAAAMVEPPR